MTDTDKIYQSLIKHIIETGDELETRNHRVKTCFDLPIVTFTSTPLVTLRKTAWKLAIKEMEWFLSGDAYCPEELRKWWEGQLNPNKEYIRGYGEQLRHSRAPYMRSFDQINYVMEGLRNNPNSRRLILTTWNPYDMAHITDINVNKNCPTTCHNTMTQFFVRNQTLHMTSYQRSADMLLGAPHNFCQSWALLMWFAHHSGLNVGSLRWAFGDSHVYLHDSHIKAANEIIDCKVDTCTPKTFALKYTPSTSKEVFIASDFTMEGIIPEPISLTKPLLL